MIINIELETEFETACDLLYLRPEEVIRAFIENVSLAKFCGSDDYLTHRNKDPATPFSLNLQKTASETERSKSLPQIATDFIFGYNALYNNRLLPAQKIQKEYSIEFEKLLAQLDDELNFATRYYRLVGFFLKWQEAVLLNISEDDAIIKVKTRKIKTIKFNNKT